METTSHLGDGEEAARALVQDALGLTSPVPAGARLGDPAAWDSLGHMRIAFALEARLGRQLQTDEIVGLTHLAAIAALLSRDPANPTTT